MVPNACLPRSTKIAILLLSVGLPAALAGQAPSADPPPAAVMVYDPAPQPPFTVYRPRDLASSPRLPVVVFGNGACRADGGAQARPFLLELASHGYMVIAPGAPGPDPAVQPTTDRVPSPRLAPVAPGADETSPAELTRAIDWAIGENSREGSELRGRIDTTAVAVMGYSCGGLQALAIQQDPRIRASLIFNSGIYDRPPGRIGVRLDKTQLARVHAPILYVQGGPTDIAFEAANSDYAQLPARVPAMKLEANLGHDGTFRQQRGGTYAVIARAWLDWWVKGRRAAANALDGADCTLCRSPDWKIERRALPPVPLERVSYPGAYQGHAEERFDGFVRSTRHVAVRDGVRLAVTIYRPARGGVATSEPLPVLFNFSPYLARRIDANGRVTGRIEQPNPRNRPFVELTRYGYVVAVADVRGKGSSFGTRAAYTDRLEGEDGHDLVQWLAAQPYADGKVGMFGCSYEGGTQWATARNTPPALKAIFPQAAQFDNYRNVRRGGIAGQFNTRPQDIGEDLPTAPVDEDVDGRLKAEALRQHERNGQMLDLVFALEHRDDRTAQDVQYWSIASPWPRVAQIRAAGIATYQWGNWLDEPADQSLISYENMRGGAGLTRLLMGPGAHCDTNTVDSFQEHLRFFDHVLKGVDNGIDREPPIAFRTTGLPEAQGWRYAHSLPLSRSAPTRLYLDAGKRLVPGTPATRREQFQVTYDVGCTVPAWAVPGVGREEATRVGPHVLPPPGYWACVNALKAQTFTTRTFAQEQWLSGFPVVSLQFQSTAEDAWVFGYLEDVAADGTAELIAHGRLRASHRRQGEAPYRNFDLPWSTGLRADAAPLRAGETVELRFELSPVSRIVRSGHRLRLSFTGADQRQRDLPRIAQDPPATWTFTYGGSNAAYVELTLTSVDELLSSTRPMRPVAAQAGP